MRWQGPFSHLLRLADDETILHKLADVLARVSHADFADLHDADRDGGEESG